MGRSNVSFLIFLLGIGIHTCTGVSEWNLCDGGSTILDKRSSMGQNILAVLNIDPVSVKARVDSNQVSTCLCVLKPVNPGLFDIQYKDKNSSLVVEPGCKKYRLNCADSLTIRSYRGAHMSSEIVFNATNSWNKAKVKPDFIQKIDSLHIQYHRQLSTPLSVRKLNLEIVATTNLNVTCTTVGRAQVGKQAPPGGQAQDDETGQQSLDNSKFIGILVGLGVAGLLIIILVLLVSHLRHRRAKRSREYEHRMNPVRRSGSSRRTESAPVVASRSSQPISDRYVPLETMYEVKRQNATPTVNDDFTVSFGPGYTGQSDDNNRGWTEPNNIEMTDLNTGQADQPEYKNIPIDDGYQSIILGSEEIVGDSEENNRYTQQANGRGH